MKRFKPKKEQIKAILEKVLKRLSQGKCAGISQLMREAGYSESSSRALKITRSKTWKELLEEIKDEPLLKKLKEIALAKRDKRANIEAIKEIFKLKDRYPKQKLTLELLNEEISKVEE